MFKYALLLVALSTTMHGASNQKKVTPANEQYVNACKLYKEHFGDPSKLFKFNPCNAEKVKDQAELVLAGLKGYARKCIKQKDAESAKEIMQLFSWADAIRLEATEGKNVHLDTFGLWQSIRNL